MEPDPDVTFVLAPKLAGEPWNKDSVPLQPSPGIGDDVTLGSTHDDVTLGSTHDDFRLDSRHDDVTMGGDAVSDDELIDATASPYITHHNREEWNELQRGESLITDNEDNSDDELILREEEAPKVHWYARLLGRYPYVVSLLVLVAMVTTFLLSWFFYPPTNFGDPTEGFETRGTPISAASQTHQHITRAYWRNQLFVSPPIPTPTTPPSVEYHIGVTPTTPEVTTTTAAAKKTCQNPETGDLVFESTSGRNLFTLGAIRAMCSIEDQYITPYLNTSVYRRYGLTYILGKLVGKPCHQIIPLDFARLERMFYYLSLCDYNATCYRKFCPKEGVECSTFVQYIHDIFNKFTDTDFQRSSTKGKPYLKYARMNLDKCADLVYFQNVLEGKEIRINGVRIIAVNFGQGTKNELFQYYIISDIRYFGLALGLVLLIMLGYLKSLTLMFATVCNVLFSFNLAYFIYFFVLRMSYFPFMNLLSMLILIAVGADDVFIFNDVWTHAQRELPGKSHDQLMSQAIGHAVISIAVTSLSTAGAFFSNIVSTITTIKCFAVFAGVCVLSNLFLMLTWTPSVIVSVDKIWIHIMGRSTKVHNNLKKVSNIFTSTSDKLFGIYIPKIVEMGRYIFIIIFLVAGIAGGFITFYKPGLHLPKSAYFELFHFNQKMEEWDRAVSLRFKDYQEQNVAEKIYATFTWGAKCKDNGDWMNPHNKGILQFDPNFDMFNEESQLALNQFTKSLNELPFVEQEERSKLSLWDMVVEEAKNICKNPIVAANSKGCCSHITFPFPKKHLDCLKFMLSSPYVGPGLMKKMYKNKRYPLFDKDGNVKIVSYWVKTNLTFSYSFRGMQRNYDKLNAFVKEQKKIMPNSMKSICFSGEGKQFILFDLQLAIATGTLTSTGVSLLMASVILFLTSLNLLLTIYATITISLAICATLGSIVLIGWELNILEATVVSMAVGLSVDFTIHYSVAYRLSKYVEPKSRVTESFHRVGFAVAVAALTTFLAGAATIPSHNMSYVKLGIFLMLVIFYSWAYATFFFQSVCGVCGPRGQYCQLQYPTESFRKLYNKIKKQLCGH